LGNKYAIKGGVRAEGVAGAGAAAGTAGCGGGAAAVDGQHGFGNAQLEGADRAASLDRAEAVEPRWVQAIDAVITRKVTEWLLPGPWCPCCGTVTFADPPPGLHPGSVSYGPVLNAAAVLLSAYANVPSERSTPLPLTMTRRRASVVPTDCCNGLMVYSFQRSVGRLTFLAGRCRLSRIR
jgi:hypothetical protein